MKRLALLLLLCTKVLSAAGWSISPASVTMSAVGLSSYPFGVSHTVSDGQDRYLIIALSARTFPSTLAATAVTFGGTSATRLTKTPASVLLLDEFWGIANPDVTTGFVGVTLDGNIPAIQGNQLCVAVYTLYGASRVQPGAARYDAPINATWLTPTASDSIVLDNFAFQNENNGLTPSAGVLIYSMPGFSDAAGNNSARGSYKALASSAPFAMGWMGANGNGRTQLVVEILAAPPSSRASIYDWQWNNLFITPLEPWR